MLTKEGGCIKKKKNCFTVKYDTTVDVTVTTTLYYIILEYGKNINWIWYDERLLMIIMKLIILGKTLSCTKYDYLTYIEIKS